MALLLFVTVSLLFGANFYLADMAAKTFSPTAVSFLRLSTGALAVLPIVLLNRKGDWKSPVQWGLARPQWGAMLIAATVGSSIPFLLIPLVLRYGADHSFLAMFLAFTPLLTILVSVPLLQIWPTKRQWMGVLGGLAMLSLVYHDAQYHAVSPMMLLLALAVPSGYAIGNTVIRRHLHAAAHLPVTIVMLGLAATSLLPWLVYEQLSPSHAVVAEVDAETWRRSVCGMLILGPLGTGVATVLFLWMLQLRGPLFAGMVTYVVPLAALFWGWIDNEPITSGQLAAMCGVLSMVALVQIAPEKSPPCPPVAAAAEVDPSICKP